MVGAIQEWVAQKIEQFNLKGLKVLEVGSYDVNGTVRQYFEASEYIGTDMQEGPNVDIAIISHELRTIFEAESFDIVVCCETLEHDLYPMLTCSILKDLLRPGGYFFISSPANGFPIHSYPKDYWRINQDAYHDALFAGLEVLALDEIRDPSDFPINIGLARKS